MAHYIETLNALAIDHGDLRSRIAHTASVVEDLRKIAAIACTLDGDLDALSNVLDCQTEPQRINDEPAMARVLFWLGEAAIALNQAEGNLDNEG